MAVDHFGGDQLFISDTAERWGIPNVPNTQHARNIETLLKPALERARTVLQDRPILITSGYRCPDVNCMVGGAMDRDTLNDLSVNSDFDVVREMAQRRIRLGMVQGSNSAHMEGRAADLTCPGAGTVIAICDVLASSDIPYDQVIYEYGRWCHFAVATNPRRMVLTIKKGWGNYRQGIIA